jgi:hypothetical protein
LPLRLLLDRDGFHYSAKEGLSDALAVGNERLDALSSEELPFVLTQTIVY